MPIYPKKIDRIVLLDEIRLDNGADKLKKFFNNLIDDNAEKAIKLINEKNVLFPSLFILQPEIKRSDLFTHLNIRNKHALEIANEILSREFSSNQRLSSEYNEEDYSALKWIFETGYRDNGLNDQYDEILDAAAIILVKVYKDKKYLHAIEGMIFDRYTKGAFIYDLVWAFFESSDPVNLFMIVNRLRSSNRKDVELARKLLNFIPCIGMNSENNPLKQYQCALKWINRNRNYLYYTGETSLQTSNPYRYAVSLEAKYLQKIVSNDFREPLRSLTEFECTLLDDFKKLDYDSRLLLSNCSSVIHRKSKRWWSKWLEYPIYKQIEIAYRISGGLR
jgi:hypothetical protein